jgi:hypothetical protein
MANDPKYNAVLSVAKSHLTQAFEVFRTDSRIPWRNIKGNVPKVQARIG